jgi:drug/metabolite transporter (DMT)-like permease
MRLRANLEADAVLVVVTLIWGSTFVVGKDILDFWPAISYMAIRLALACALLILLFGKQLARASREAWKAGTLLGLLIGVGLAGQSTGLAYTTPSKSAFITGLTTPLVPFVAFALLRVRPTLENILGIALASIGGALILAPTQEVGGVQFGDLLSLLCTGIFATHITLLSRYAQRHDARQLTVLQIAVAAVLLVVFWLGIKLVAALFGAEVLPEELARNAAPLVWNARILWQLVYLASVSTVAVFLMWTWAQARMSATHAAIIFSLEPVFATALAALWRDSDELPGSRAAFGAALVLAGVIVSELRWTNLRRGKAARSERDAAAKRPSDAEAVQDEDEVEVGYT